MVCDRFKCLPSAALAEDASLLRLLRVEALGRRPDAPGEGVDPGGW